MIAAVVLGLVLAADPVDLGTADHDLLSQIAANTAATCAAVQAAGDAAAADAAAGSTFRQQLLFLAQVAAFGVCFSAGALSWRLFILAKNQGRFW